MRSLSVACVKNVSCRMRLAYAPSLIFAPSSIANEEMRQHLHYSYMLSKVYAALSRVRRFNYEICVSFETHHALRKAAARAVRSLAP